MITKVGLEIYKETKLNHEYNKGCDLRNIIFFLTVVL